MIQFLIIKVSKVTETLKIRHVNALDIRKDRILEIRRFSRSKPRESVGEIKQGYLSQALNSVKFIYIKNPVTSLVEGLNVINDPECNNILS